VADELRPVYLVAGTDRPKIGRALARLRGRFAPGAVDLLDAESTSGSDAVAACNALGLLGPDGGRLVVVGGVERWKKEDVEAVAAYLRDPAPGTVLALVASESPKQGGLGEACERAGQVLVYDVPKPKDPSAWVRAELARVDVPTDEEAARALVEIVGPDVTALAPEIEKLADWAAGSQLRREDVELLAVPGSEEPGWALTDAWGSRDLATVLALAEGELERGTEPFLVAVRLASHVALVRAVQALSDEGLGAREMGRRVRKHEFRVRTALRHAENYSREELDDAIVRLAELDAALKGASRASGELELERALVDLTRRVEHPAAA
jgi:DNA polymerase III subunit delta